MCLHYLWSHCGVIVLALSHTHHACNPSSHLQAAQLGYSTCTRECMMGRVKCCDNFDHIIVMMCNMGRREFPILYIQAWGHTAYKGEYRHTVYCNSVRWQNLVVVELNSNSLETFAVGPTIPHDQPYYFITSSWKVLQLPINPQWTLTFHLSLQHMVSSRSWPHISHVMQWWRKQQNIGGGAQHSVNGVLLVTWNIKYHYELVISYTLSNNWYCPMLHDPYNDNPQ